MASLPAASETAAELSQSIWQVLLVGNREEDFFLIREILLDYDIADVKAVHLLSEAPQAEASTPFVLLTEHADEKTVAEIIAAGAWDCMEKSELNGANLVRTIGCALALHSMQQGRQFAEDSLRNMSRAVEQSADAIMITHRQGIIEYVNPDLNSKGILPPGSHRTDAANS